MMLEFSNKLVNWFSVYFGGQPVSPCTVTWDSVSDFRSSENPRSLDWHHQEHMILRILGFSSLGLSFDTPAL